MDNKDLLSNIKRIFNSAEMVYNSKDFTSAAILYFKTLFTVLDLILLIHEGKTPKDHTERSRMLERSHPELYEILDKFFDIYRSTYSVSIDKYTCDKVRENVRKIIEEYKIQV